MTTIHAQRMQRRASPAVNGFEIAITVTGVRSGATWTLATCTLDEQTPLRFSRASSLSALEQLAVMILVPRVGQPDTSAAASRRLAAFLETPLTDFELSARERAQLAKGAATTLGSLLFEDHHLKALATSRARLWTALRAQTKERLRIALEAHEAGLRDLLEADEAAAAGTDSDTYSDADGLWQPGHDLLIARDAIIGYGGRPPLQADIVMDLVGVTTRQALARRRAARQLLALPLGPRRFVYPAWQFVPGPSGHLVPGLRTVLVSAPVWDPWGIAQLLTTPQAAVGGAVPIDALNDPLTRDETITRTIGVLQGRYE